MKKWARFLKRAREEQGSRLNIAIVAANNHYAGLGLVTAYTFRKMLDLSEVAWNDVNCRKPEKEHLATQNKLVYQII
jgi:hypothetical protein